MSLDTKAQKKFDKFKHIKSQLYGLQGALATIGGMLLDEQAHLDASYRDFLGSCGFKDSTFFSLAAADMMTVGFKSKHVQDVLKYIMDTYIAVTEEQKAFYKDRLECLNMTGSNYEYHRGCVDQPTFSVTLKDIETSKIFEVGIPVKDNCKVYCPEDVSNGVGKIKVWNLTPKFSDDIDITEYDIYHSSGVHPIFCNTYDPAECAAAIYDYLTSSKYDSFASEDYTVIMQTNYGFGGCLMSEVLNDFNRRMRDNIDIDSYPEKESSKVLAEQVDIDKFIDLYDAFMSSRFVKAAAKHQQNIKQIA